MITYEELSDYAEENNLTIKLFDNPRYPNSIIGLTHYNRAIYDMEQIISDLMAEDEINYIDALEFIEYNTLRAFPYERDTAPAILCQKEVIKEGANGTKRV